MRFLSDKDALDSEVFMDYNYGNLDIEKAVNGTAVSLSASVRDREGKEVIRRDYSRSDLAFNADNLLNSELCLARASK